VTPATKKALRRFGLTLGLALCLVALHQLMLRWMLESQVAAQLLSASADADLFSVFAALLFLMLRLGVYVVVPGLVVYAFIRLGWRLHRARGGARRPAAPAPPRASRS